MRLSGADRGPSHQEVAGPSPTGERRATDLGPPDGRAPAEDPGGVLALPSPCHSWHTSEGAMQPLFRGHGSLESRMNQTGCAASPSDEIPAAGRRGSEEMTSGST